MNNKAGIGWIVYIGLLVIITIIIISIVNATSLSYTDDNTGESIIIKSDKQTYSGLSHAEGVFSLNETGDIYISIYVNASNAEWQRLEKGIVTIQKFNSTYYTNGKIINCSKPNLPNITYNFTNKNCYEQVKHTTEKTKEVIFWQDVPLRNIDIVLNSAKTKTTKGLTAQKYAIVNSKNKDEVYRFYIKNKPNTAGEFIVEAYKLNPTTKAIEKYGQLDPNFGDGWRRKVNLTINSNMVVMDGTSQNYAVSAIWVTPTYYDGTVNSLNDSNIATGMIESGNQPLYIKAKFPEPYVITQVFVTAGQTNGCYNIPVYMSIYEGEQNTTELSAVNVGASAAACGYDANGCAKTGTQIANSTGNDTFIIHTHQCGATGYTSLLDIYLYGYQLDEAPIPHLLFPVLITEDNLPAEMLNRSSPYHPKSDGSDLRFSSDVEGNNELAFEIVRYEMDGLLSRGKGYDKSLEPNLGGAYPDTGGIEATDGKLGSSAYIDTEWMGWYQVADRINITVNLEQQEHIQNVRFHYLSSNGAGIYHPDNLQVYGSDDNITFSLTDLFYHGSDWSEADGTTHWSNYLSMDENYQYVRFAFTSYNPNVWLFLSEVEVNLYPYNESRAKIWVSLGNITEEQYTAYNGFYGWYNNSNADGYAASDTYGSYNVWNNYTSVHHLLGANISQIKDSTRNTIDGDVDAETPTYNSQGMWDSSKAVYFDSNDAEYVQFEDSDLMEFTDNFTVEASYKPNSATPDIEGIFIKYNSLTGGWLIWKTIEFGKYSFYTNGADGVSNLRESVATNDVNWHRIVGTVSSKNHLLYVDGSETGGGDTGKASGVAAEAARIGTLYSNVVFYGANGAIDELRTSNITRTSGWLATDANMQLNPANFIIEGEPMDTDDITNPVLTFVSPTTSAGLYEGNQQIQANVTMADTYPANFTIYLYNESGMHLMQSNFTNLTQLYIDYGTMGIGVYHLNATGYDTSGNKGNTSTIVITIQADATPPIIDSFSILSIGTDFLLINWSAHDTNGVNYTLFVNDSTGIMACSLNNTQLTSFTCSGLTYNTTYIITLNATDSYGNSNYSTITGTTTDLAYREQIKLFNFNFKWVGKLKNVLEVLTKKLTLVSDDGKYKTEQIVNSTGTYFTTNGTKEYYFNGNIKSNNLTLINDTSYLNITPNGIQSGVNVMVDDMGLYFSSSEYPSIKGETVIHNLQSSSGFSFYGCSNYSFNTTDYVRGNQSIQMVSNNTGDACYFRKNLASPIDLSGKYVKIYVKFDNISRISQFSIALSSDNFATDNYQWVTTSTLGIKNGVWETLTYSFGHASTAGTPDRSAINAIQYKIVDQSTGNLTGMLGGISAFNEAPKAMVSITFDDGWVSQYTEARKKMDEYNFAGTAYIIPEILGTTGTENKLTLSQALELQNLHGWDISAHGLPDFTSLTSAELEDYLLTEKNFLLRNGFTKGADHIAYPGGQYNDDTVIPIVRKYFKTGRTIASPTETFPPRDYYKLRCLNVDKDDLYGTLADEVDKAIAGNEWLIINFHRVTASPSTSLEYSITKFGWFIDYLNYTGVDVRPVSDVFNMQEDQSNIFHRNLSLYSPDGTKWNCGVNDGGNIECH